MEKIGRWWIVNQNANQGEIVRWSGLANRIQGNRAVGGKLFLTNYRFLFNPHLIDYIFFGKKWNVNLQEVLMISKEPSDGANPFNGSLRARLKIDMRDGRTELFIVNKVNHVIELMKKELHTNAENNDHGIGDTL